MSILIGTPLNDTLTGDAGGDNTIVGEDSIPAGGTGGNDTLTGGGNSSNTIFGEVGSDLRDADGGDDVLSGGTNSTNVMFGDAGGDLVAGMSGPHGSGSAHGGDDVLIGGSNSTNVMVGDVGGDAIGRGRSHTRGGNDVLTGGASSINTLIGDVQGALEGSVGGDDVLVSGANSVNNLVGDAHDMLNVSVAGDDVLTGGANSTNALFGDAAGRIYQSTGGDDSLTGGANGDNTLVGDADVLDDAFGGDDLLVSGTGTDDMWGDARQLFNGATGGRDVFRFLTDNGDDTIHDFERGKDLIDVNDVTVTSGIQTATAQSRSGGLVQSAFDTLDIEETDANHDGMADSVIHFDANNSVTVLGVTGLTETDFGSGFGTSYVLFGRTSAPIGTRDKWLGSEGNNQASNTPGGGFRGSAFNADAATAAGTVLAGAGFADYVADGILTNANVAMFDLTESPPGVFATGAAADLETKIASSTPLFGGAKTDLDPAQSNVDATTGELHLAQTDADWNGIKNIEVSLDSTTSLRDIRLENFVDTRVKIGDASPAPGTPDGAVFDVALLGTKRGEVDASHAPAAIALTLDVWTNNGTFQNSFDIKGSVFDDVVTIGPGEVGTSPFPIPGYIPGHPQPPNFDEPGLLYTGVFTTVFANLGAGDDHYDTFTDFIFGGLAGRFSVRDVVWGGSGDDRIQSGNGNDRLFGDNGSGAWLNPDPLPIGRLPGNDWLDAGAGADWLEGNTDTGQFEIQPSGGTPRFLHIVTHGDHIDCGRVAAQKHLPFNGELPDSERDVVNFNAGDGFDVVRHFGPFAIVPGAFPPPQFGANDVLRIEDVGTLTTEVINSSEGMGTLVQNGAGSVFLVGVTTPLAQSVDGKYMLLFDAT